MTKDYKEVETFNDFTGRIVRVGDEIVFPSRVSSSMWLNKATVLKIESCRWTTRNSAVAHDRTDWRITVQVPGNTRVSRLEAVERIVLVRTAEQIERERHPSRPANIITFGEAAYE